MPRVLIWVLSHYNLLSLFSDIQRDLLETSQYESDEDQQKNDRPVRIREAEAEENLRLKALKRKLTIRMGSPLGTSRKVQSGSKQPTNDSLEPMSKKNKSTKIKDLRDNSLIRFINVKASTLKSAFTQETS